MHILRVENFKLLHCTKYSTVVYMGKSKKKRVDICITDSLCGTTETNAVKQLKVKSFSRVRLFVTPWTVAHQAPQSKISCFHCKEEKQILGHYP